MGDQVGAASSTSTPNSGLVVEAWEEVQQDLLIPYEENQLKTLIHNLIGKREVSVKLILQSNEELNLAHCGKCGITSKTRGSSRQSSHGQGDGTMGQRLEAAMKKHKQIIINH